MPADAWAPLAHLDATALAAMVRSREVSPRELVAAAIAYAERVDPHLNAIVHRQFDEALARAASPSLPDGPFRGVPFLLKDMGGLQQGHPCTQGSRALKAAAWPEPADAYLTRRFLDAGLVVLGRTNTPELGLLPTTEPLAHGPTRNPWNLDYSAGGSSGGSAAAVAAGMVPLAHASDGGGSIRVPASMCGLVGLKPTRGRCSFGPALGERWSGFSSEFAVGRSVRDVAALLDVAAGPMPGDPYSAPPPARPWRDAITTPPPQLRIGLFTGSLRGVPVDAECRDAAERAGRVLADLGHVVEPSHPAALEDPQYVQAFIAIVLASTARAVSGWEQRLGRPLTADEIEPLTAAVVERGRAASGVDVLTAIEQAHQFGRRLAEWWSDGWDVLLTPTCAAPPPRLGSFASTPAAPANGFARAVPFTAYTLPFNMSGQPALSLPLHWSHDGLPIGAQVVGAYGREDVLLQVAAQLEATLPWRDRYRAFAAPA